MRRDARYVHIRIRLSIREGTNCDVTYSSGLIRFQKFQDILIRLFTLRGLIVAAYTNVIIVMVS